jgi:hypothetical protein
MTNDIFVFILQNRLIQTSQTGGQQCSDTSPFCIPCSHLYLIFAGKAGGAYWSGATKGTQVTHSYIGKHSSSLQNNKNYCCIMFLYKFFGLILKTLYGHKLFLTAISYSVFNGQSLPLLFHICTKARAYPCKAFCRIPI